MTSTVAHFLTFNDMERGFKEHLDHTLEWADRVVVTDNHSTDGTFEYALNSGCVTAFADQPIPLFQWEEFLKLSWRFIKMTLNQGDWVINLFGDEYIEWSDVNLSRFYAYVGATAEIHQLWDLDEKLERVDDYWHPYYETRIYQYFPTETCIDLRKDHHNPAAHSRHVLPRYIELAQRHGRMLDLNAQVYSMRYALDLKREGVIHREFSPVKFKDAPYGAALLMRADY